jgi:hypothetical protein
MPKDNIQRAIDKASKGDRELRGSPLRGLRPRGVSADHRRGADRQPQPHRHQRPHRLQQERRQSGRERVGPATASIASADQLSRGCAGDAEKVFEAALEAGAEDVTSTEDGHEIWTAAADLHEVAKMLEPVLGEAETRQARLETATMVEVDEADARDAAQADRRARRRRRRPDRVGQLRQCPTR